MSHEQGGDSYIPSYGNSGRNSSSSRWDQDRPNSMYQFQGNQQQSRNDKPGGGKFKFRHQQNGIQRGTISSRPLLARTRGTSPGIVFGSTEGASKFRPVDDLSDSEENDMDISTADDEENQPPKKRRQVESTWCNPDPYTALPPVDEQSKKVDVVRLIRKGRVKSTAPTDSPTSKPEGAEDFISLSIGDIDVPVSDMPPDKAPKGPKVQVNRTQIPSGAAGPGKRKHDALSEPSQRPAPKGKLFKAHEGGMILQEWTATSASTGSPTPWFQPSTAPQDLVGVSLHQEIFDFYEWVRPRDFEHEVRLDLIARLQSLFTRREPGCKLEAFGSFAAGLYLPTGDMDLVLTTYRAGPRTISNDRRPVWIVSDVVNRAGVAVPGSLTTIAKAKVPIVKFVDAETGLKVDICVNNSTGLTANTTFHTWKTQHPALPVLVSIIKHFLMIRGLNDNATGGLGGFSIICLVTSLLQVYPSTGGLANLGQLLLYFFRLYGNVFNKTDLAIRLDPPGYIPKSTYAPFLNRREPVDRLAIIDPNQADNNISGGSGEVNLIFDCFSRAYQDLKDLMSQREGSRLPPESLLGDLIGGDYEAYRAQRERLRQIHSSHFAQARYAYRPPSPVALQEKRNHPFNGHSRQGARGPYN